MDPEKRKEIERNLEEASAIVLSGAPVPPNAKSPRDLCVQYLNDCGALWNEVEALERELDEQAADYQDLTGVNFTVRQERDNLRKALAERTQERDDARRALDAAMHAQIDMINQRARELDSREIRIGLKQQKSERVVQQPKSADPEEAYQVWIDGTDGSRIRWYDGPDGEPWAALKVDTDSRFIDDRGPLGTMEARYPEYFEEFDKRHPREDVKGPNMQWRVRHALERLGKAINGIDPK